MTKRSDDSRGPPLTLCPSERRAPFTGPPFALECGLLAACSSFKFCSISTAAASLSLSLSLCLALVCPRESWGVFFCRFFTQFPPLQISTQLVKCITVSCRKRTSHTLRHEQSSLHSTDSNTCLLHTATHCPPAASRAQLLASLLEQTASESQSAREESSGKLSQPEAGQFAARQRVESGSRFGAAKNRGPKLGRRSKQNNRRRRRAKLDGL